MNTADILVFFDKLQNLENLKKVVVYHPTWNDVNAPKAFDDSIAKYAGNSRTLCGVKLWDIAGFLKIFKAQERNIMIELAVPGKLFTSPWFIERWLGWNGAGFQGRQLVSLAKHP